MKKNIPTVVISFIVGVISTFFYVDMRNDALTAERKIAEEKAYKLNEIGEAARKEVRDEIFLRKREIENATNEAKRRASEAHNIRENEIRLKKVRLDRMKRLNEAEQVLKSLRGE